MSELYAGIEGRGDRFHCVVGTGPDDLRAAASFPATTPEETLGQVTEYLRPQRPTAVGIACFGPLDLPGGRITYTLKPGWQGFPVVVAVRDALGVPVALDTDVNAAAIAEGAARGRSDLLFVTLGTGTGIGAGALTAGRPVHGATHPEMGHLPVARHPDDPMPGRCPYHGGCLEGLATSAAMTARWGVPLPDLPPRAVELEAWYLAQLAAAATYLLSPEVVVVDGAAVLVPGLVEAVAAATRTRLADDPAVARLTADIGAYVQPSVLGGRAAQLGALALARSIAGK